MKSTHSTGRGLRRTATVIATGIVMAVALAACSSGSTTASSDKATASDIAAALQKKSTITVWSWSNPVKAVVADFMKKYPNVTVKLVNAGTGADEYTKLQNAIKAGSGAPDVAQIEYFALPQFALSKSLANLDDFGMSSLESKFTTGTWSNVSLAGGLYALPQDSGPMVMYYNEKVFAKYGLAVPTTWAEYAAAAEKLHAADPTKYITSDSGDAGFTTSMIWQAGGKPYTTDGTKVTINLQDAGAKKWTGVWNPLVSKGLVSPIVGWTDEWYKGLGDGTLATLLSGAWMPANFVSGITASSGDWRAAPMPTYDGGAAATAENGGSSDAVLEQSKNKLVAAGFLQYMNAEQAGTAAQIAGGNFPSTTADLNDPAFLDLKSDYFGGQQINKVLVQASKDVVTGWSYLPFQGYANSIYSDSVGQAYATKSDINAGLQTWAKSSAEYGNEQGYTVTVK